MIYTFIEKSLISYTCKQSLFISIWSGNSLLSYLITGYHNGWSHHFFSYLIHNWNSFSNYIFYYSAHFIKYSSYFNYDYSIFGRSFPRTHTSFYRLDGNRWLINYDIMLYIKFIHSFIHLLGDKIHLNWNLCFIYYASFFFPFSLFLIFSFFSCLSRSQKQLCINRK